MTAFVYPADAACARHPHPEWWDGRRDGEPADARQKRQQQAARVCRRCPVTDQCWAGRDRTEGVRAGRWGGKCMRLPEDEVPPVALPIVPVAPDSRAVPLTPRQTEVLACLARGLSAPHICERLGISNWTLRAHVKAVLAAMSARDRAHAVQLVLSGAVTIRTDRRTA
jgi:DNA-binding CsgD family transcriptional regulator